MANFVSELPVNIIKEGSKIDSGEIKIEVVKAIHGFCHLLSRNKAEINENVGYILNIEGKKIYITSDTVSFKNDYKCDLLFLPINNHGVVMGPFEAAMFAKETKAQLVIPTHMDNPSMPVNIEWAKKEFEKEGVNYKFLNFKETIEF